MEKALFGLTILGMKSEDHDVAKLAVEFWSTVCEEEVSIEDDNAHVESADQIRPFYNFARVAANEVVPVLLELLTKQDEDATDEEYTLSRAAYQCLQLYAQAVGATIIQIVLKFVEDFIRSEDWRYRDAAVSAFGAIMEGPDEKVLTPLVKQALPTLISMMDDQSLTVKDSTAYALGRITEACSDAIDPQQHLQALIESLFKGLLSNAKMAPSCCWALMNLAERFAGDFGASSNPITPFFNQAVATLMQVTAGGPTEASDVRTAAYEVLNVFVQNAATESLPAVAELTGAIIQRLQESAAMQSQTVSIEEKIRLEEAQNSLATVLQGIITRRDKEIAPQGDAIMETLLSILTNVDRKSSVPEAIFATISTLATAMEEDFEKYLSVFVPFLLSALSNKDEPSICSMAIGLVSDITRSTGIKSQPYCDEFMNHLLECLRNQNFGTQFKPAILQCFGDIAGAIGGHFETYLQVVATVLEQASTFTAPPEGPYELFDYVISLREGIMDAWGGVIGAMKSSGKTQVLQQYVPAIVQVLGLIATDQNRSESLMRAAMGVIGDLADAYPNGELVDAFRQDWMTVMIKETKTNREFSPRTIETARWAREQVKRQLGGSQNIMAQS
jgi:importin subunit beta-1